MERMPCHDPPASSLPAGLHLETSLSGLWADRQGLDLGQAEPCAATPRVSRAAGTVCATLGERIGKRREATTSATMARAARSSDVRIT